VSYEVVDLVLKHSRSRGATRMVLVVIGTYSNSDATGAFPSIDTIARKAGISERAVQYSLRDAVKLRELKIHREAGRSNRYEITITPADIAPPQDLHPRNGLHPTPADVAPGGAAGCTRSVLALSPNSSSKKRERKKKVGTSWPDGFALDDSLREYALKEKFDPDREFKKFHNKAEANGYTAKDWRAKFRTWIDRAVEYRERYGGAGDQPGTWSKDLKSLLGEPERPRPLLKDEVRKSMGMGPHLSPGRQRLYDEIQRLQAEDAAAREPRRRHPSVSRDEKGRASLIAGERQQAVTDPTVTCEDLGVEEEKG
jgi:hypothetical protein